MPTEIILPKFGFTLESCKIVQWLAEDGDAVREGDPICEVETDKVNMEVEAPADGTLYSPLYEEGEDVPVTWVIAYLLEEGEKPPAEPPKRKPLPSESGAPAAEPEPETQATPQPTAPTNGGSGSVTASPVAQRMAAEANIDLQQIQGTGPKGRITRQDVETAISDSSGVPGKVRATPAARRIASESGIDIMTVSGTGPRGRIQSADVKQAVAAMKTAATRPITAPATNGDRGNLTETIKLTGMRKTIATRLQKSFQTAPHIFFDASVDTAGIERLRAKVKANNERLSVTSILVKASAWALQRHRWLNATINDEEVTLWNTCNIGVAVALDEGLIVPVVYGAESMGMSTIQTRVDDVATRARDGALKPDDMVDGTFTISNLGMYGVDRFTAIINPPQVAILAVSRTQQQFVPDEHGQPVLKSFMTLTLSTDHRVVDGAQAANFLQDLRNVLEEPALLAF